MLENIQIPIDRCFDVQWNPPGYPILSVSSLSPPYGDQGNDEERDGYYTFEESLKQQQQQLSFVRNTDDASYVIFEQVDFLLISDDVLFFNGDPHEFFWGGGYGTLIKGYNLPEGSNPDPAQYQTESIEDSDMTPQEWLVDNFEVIPTPAPSYDDGASAMPSPVSVMPSSSDAELSSSMPSSDTDYAEISSSMPSSDIDYAELSSSMPSSDALSSSSMPSSDDNHHEEEEEESVSSVVFEMMLSGVPPDTTMDTLQSDYLTDKIGTFLEDQISNLQVDTIIIENQVTLGSDRPLRNRRHRHSRNLQVGKRKNNNKSTPSPTSAPSSPPIPTAKGMNKGGMNKNKNNGKNNNNGKNGIGGSRKGEDGILGIEGLIIATHPAYQTIDEFAQILDTTLTNGENDLVAEITNGLNDDEELNSRCSEREMIRSYCIDQLSFFTDLNELDSDIEVPPSEQKEDDEKEDEKEDSNSKDDNKGIGDWKFWGDNKNNDDDDASSSDEDDNKGIGDWKFWGDNKNNDDAPSDANDIEKIEEEESIPSDDESSVATIFTTTTRIGEKDHLLLITTITISFVVLLQRLL